jgi:hypothetical protein
MSPILRIHLRITDTVMSRFMAWCMGERYSHIGIELREGLIFHSDKHGCHISTTKEFYEHTKAGLMIPLPCTWLDHTVMLERAIGAIDTRYDFLGVLGFGVFLLLRKVGLALPVPLMNPSWLMCSEYAEFILHGTKTTQTPVEVARDALKTHGQPPSPLLG